MSSVSSYHSMTMSPETAVEGFNADVHKCGAQNPQLSESMKRTETDEQKPPKSLDSRNYSQNSNGTEETRMDSVSSELASPAALDTPLLHRIDRLDILLDYLQDKGTTIPLTMNGNIQHSTLKVEENGFQERCKPISWVLEEIQAKGTIIDRIATLEERVTKLAEELERRKSPKQCINVMEGVRLHLNGPSGCDIFVEEKKMGITPSLPCESVEKGLHEQFSKQFLQALDTPKSWFPLQDKRNEGGMKEEDGNNESRSQRKGRKGKLRRMLPECMRRPSI